VSRFKLQNFHFPLDVGMAMSGAANRLICVCFDVCQQFACFKNVVTYLCAVERSNRKKVKEPPESNALGESSIRLELIGSAHGFRAQIVSRGGQQTSMKTWKVKQSLKSHLLRINLN
jgi:hypothetical protein